MALTRPVTDFKDSVKAATTTSITLNGGAPTTVDGVSLSLADSVLVKSQSDPTQNGLYRVTTLGTGSNGTWTRRADFNDFRQVTSGALVFIEQGTLSGNVFYYLQGGLGNVTVGSTPINFGNLTYDISSTITFGATYSNSTVASYLPTYSGTLTAGTITTLSGGQHIGYHTGAIGANTANSGVFTSVTTTGGGQLTGYITGAIGANTANSGVFTSVTTTGGGQLTGYITGAIGANTANSGVFTTLTATSGYQGAVSGPLNGTLGATTPNSVVATSITTTSGGQLIGYLTGAIGANTANTGAFTTITTTGNITATGYLIPSANVTYDLGTPTARWRTLYLSGNTIDLGGTILSGDTSGSFNVGSLNATAVNGATIGNSGAVISGASQTLTGASQAASYITSSGGQITGYITGSIGANTANTGAFTTVTASGITTLTNATDSTNSSSGGLIVSGGLGVAKNTFIGGNLTVVGNLAVQGLSTTIGSTDLTVNDSVINLHTYPNLTAWTVNDGRDIGFKLHYFDATLASGDNLAFLGRVNTSGFLEYYTTGTENSSNVFTSGTYGTVKTGELVAANSTVSTSTSTGALRVSGGAGITGNVYVGGGINGIIGNGTAAAGTFTSVTTTSAGQITGYHTGAIGANIANTGTFTSVTTTSAGQITGYHTGAIGANIANTGTFTTLTTTGDGTISGNLTITGNLTANGSAGTAGYVLSSNGSSANVYWRDPSVPRSNVQTTATSITIDSSLYDQYIVTALASAISFPASTTGSPTNGKKMIIRIKDNGTAQTITWTTSGAGGYRAIGVTLPTTTVISKIMYVGCIYNSTESFWDVIAYTIQA